MTAREGLFRSLWPALQRTLKGLRRQPGPCAFLLRAEDELWDLAGELAAGTWAPRPTTMLVVQDPKRRVIAVPQLRDRVVHQWLAPQVEPAHERRYITDTFACRRGRGLHPAVARARAWSRSFRWFVRLDVEQYFPTIDHAVVRSQLACDVRDAGVRAFIERCLPPSVARPHHVPGDDLFTPVGRAIGLPLGSLTSQLLANRYLDRVDHLAKDRLRLRGYLRYMDDLLLFHDDRTVLTAHARTIEEACHGLRLRLHRWEILPTAGGIGALGYRFVPGQVRVKRSTVARAEHRLHRSTERWRAGEVGTAAFEAGLEATFAHWAHADSFRLRERTLRRLGLLYEPGLE